MIRAMGERPFFKAKLAAVAEYGDKRDKHRHLLSRLEHSCAFTAGQQPNK
jgi:hypothetical protein